LLGSDLRICVYTHEGSSTTEPINIYCNTDKYLKIIAWFNLSTQIWNFWVMINSSWERVTA
jgi:hypothetical protein